MPPSRLSDSTHEDQADVEIVLAKKSLVLSDVNDPFSFTDRADGHDDFAQWRRDLRPRYTRCHSADQQGEQSERPEFQNRCWR